MTTPRYLPAFRAGIHAGYEYRETPIDDILAEGPDALAELALEQGVEAVTPEEARMFVSGLRTGHAMVVLAEPVTVHGSLRAYGTNVGVGAETTEGGKRTRAAVVVAANADAWLTLTDAGEIVHFDNIWVCDQPALFGEGAPVPVFG